MSADLDALLTEVDIRAPGNTGNWSGDFQLDIPDPELARRLAAAVRDLQADSDTLRRIDAYSLARMFHEAYERLAPEFNYKTRKASAVPWDDVPEHNKALMIATARAVLDLLIDGGGDG